MSGAIPLFHLFALMAWKGNIFTDFTFGILGT